MGFYDGVGGIGGPGKLRTDAFCSRNRAIRIVWSLHALRPSN
jgi:hypothetical protein